MTERKNAGHLLGPAIRRHVEIGGVSKTELIRRLQDNQVSLNAYAERLFADERFETSHVSRTLLTVELSVRDLGFFEGVMLPQVFAKADELGLKLCPFELAPHLRLQDREQADGGSASAPDSNRAPGGSVTVASEPLSEDDEFPKGFYLRNIDGTLWLRGYRCDLEHVWQADDRFVFVATP